MLVRIAAVLMLGLVPWAALAQPDKTTPPPDKGARTDKSAPEMPEPSFVLAYLVATLLTVGVMLVVCMPSRKG